MIRAKVVYTPEHLKQHYLSLYKVFTIACSIVVVLCVILVILSSLVFKMINEPLPPEQVKRLIFIISSSIFLIFLNIWLYFIQPHIFIKNHRKKYGDSPMLYEFDENEMRASCKGADFNENVAITYDKLDKVRETPKCFLLFPEKNLAYVIGKHEITEGTADDLRNLLKSKLGKKFK